jgi:ankyrin repeat protein
MNKPNRNSVEAADVYVSVNAEHNTPARQFLWALPFLLALALLVGAPVVIGRLFMRRYGDPELVRAAAGGDAATVRERLRRGAPANSYHLEGSSALWWAVNSGSLETVRVLLGHGADPNSSGQFNTVIEEAVAGLEMDDGKPRRAIAQALLDQAPRITNPQQVALLREALRAAAGQPSGRGPRSKR